MVIRKLKNKTYVCVCVCVYTYIHTYIYSETNWIGHILRMNRLLKRVIEGKVEGKIEVMGVDEEEDVSSYSMSLRKRDDAENRKRKH